MVAAEIDELRAGVLQLGDDRAIILLARIDALEQDLGHAGGVQLVLHHGGQAFAVSRLVVQDGDLLALVFLGDPGRDELALRVVARVKAHDRRMALFGQHRIRRRGAHHQDVVVGVDVGRRDRRARAGVAVDELDLLADDEIGDGDRLLRIAGVVLDDDLDLAPVDAAGVVDRGGGGSPRRASSVRRSQATGPVIGPATAMVMSSAGPAPVSADRARPRPATEAQDYAHGHSSLDQGGCRALDAASTSGAAGHGDSREPRRWQPRAPSPTRITARAPIVGVQRILSVGSPDASADAPPDDANPSRS